MILLEENANKIITAILKIIQTKLKVRKRAEQKEKRTQVSLVNLLEYLNYRKTKVDNP